ncbi:hypothetical protein BDZ45DRAFT_799615 [Acephala macrosclerotiorum]|nr:hypothetical protein BDZ45DRAFT_799615 [Acephala macrosclerotiorum]
MNKTITLYFEKANSGLATGVWLWLLLDTIFGPTHHHWYCYNGPRGPRIARAATSSILLFILYYPTLIYTIFEDWYESEVPSEDQEVTAGQDQGERQPLLS